MEKDINYEHTYELCPICGNEVMLNADFKIQKCPVCGGDIKPCSLCEMDIVDCNHCELDKIKSLLYKVSHTSEEWKFINKLKRNK